MTPFASSEPVAHGVDTDAGGGPGRRAPSAKVTLLMFASAREAAGTGRAEIEAASVAEVLDEAERRYGSEFSKVLRRCRVWLNGDPVGLHEPLRDGDEVAVLPPVSGG
jgi:molybdopterin synthase sulfur carrier subunit